MRLFFLISHLPLLVVLALPSTGLSAAVEFERLSDWVVASGGLIRDLEVEGDLAYLLDSRSDSNNGADQLRIVDVSDARAPKLVGGYAGLGELEHVYLKVRESLVYTHDATTLIVLDASHPEFPAEVGRLVFAQTRSSSLRGFYLVENLLMAETVGFHWADEIHFIDVTDPTDPKLLNSWTDFQSFYGNRLSLHWAGQSFGLLSLEWNSLELYDFSDPFQPRWMADIPSLRTSISAIELVDDWAMVASYPFSFQAFQIASALHPAWTPQGAITVTSDDSTPPYLVNVSVGASRTNLTLTFNEPVSVFVATDPFIYVITPQFSPIGLGPTAASASGNRVGLVVPQLDPNSRYTLSVYSMEDQHGNRSFMSSIDFCTADLRCLSLLEETPGQAEQPLDQTAAVGEYATLTAVVPWTNVYPEDLFYTWEELKDEAWERVHVTDQAQWQIGPLTMKDDGRVFRCRYHTLSQGEPLAYAIDNDVARLASSGAITFAAFRSGRIIAIDMADPAHPVLAGEIDLDQGILDMEADGAKLYVSLERHGMVILRWFSGTNLRIVSGAQGNEVRWDAGTLQFAPTLVGPWSDVPAASPLKLAPLGKEGYFRVRRTE